MQGNLDPATLPVANLYADWNVFWDPPASDWLLRSTDFPVTLFPLDITDHVPLTKEFMGRLLVQGKTLRYSDLAAQSWGLVLSETFYDLWDVVTTCYLAHPEYFAAPCPMRLRVTTKGDKEGSIAAGR